MVISFELEATRSLFGEKATWVTSSECPARMCSEPTSVAFSTEMTTGVKVGAGVCVGMIVGVRVAVGRPIVAEAVEVEVTVSTRPVVLTSCPGGLAQETIKSGISRNGLQRTKRLFLRLCKPWWVSPILRKDLILFINQSLSRKRRSRLRRAYTNIF